MKRELRFRIYNKKEDKMYLSPEGIHHLGSWLDAHFNWSKSYENDLIVMQSTGLKDKNGKEIYEGDVVSVPYITPFGENTESEDEEKRTHVVFEFGEFSLKYTNHNEALKSWCKRTEGEYIPNYGNKTIFEPETSLTVIGNTHELNQTK